MFKPKENVFIDKFQLLNSQENSEDINWSSSETTDTENASINERVCSLSTKVQSRKRKRRIRVSKNISNLDVTVVDLSKEHKGDTSPIIKRKSDKTFVVTSPILKGSPKLILASKPCGIKSVQPKSADTGSPILLQKHSCPNTSTKTRKKLFKTAEVDSFQTCTDGRKSPVFMTNKSLSEKQRGIRRTEEDCVANAKMSPKSDNGYLESKKHTSLRESEKKSIKDYVEKIDRRKHTNKSVVEVQGQHSARDNVSSSFCLKDSSVTSIENTSMVGNTSEESFVIKSNNSVELAKKVKAYFDSHFSSESPSQHSITETQTPKEETKSDEIEIVSSLNQLTTSNKNSFVSVKIESSVESFGTDFLAEKTKNNKYKKDGLAYRLNALLKKQNANVSLWQHERYLAANSSFEVPKGENSVFRIRKVSFKYGCYLIDAIDFKDEEFLISINSQFITCELNEDAILKLYQPYTILGLNNENRKLIINAFKFECISLL